MRAAEKKEREKPRAFSLLFRFRDTRPSQEAEKTPHAMHRAAARNATLHEARTYFGFLAEHFRRGTPYALYRRIRAFVYPAILIGRIFRIASYVFLVIRASAVLILTVTVLAVLLPPLLLWLLVTALLALHDRLACDRRFAHLIDGRRVLVFLACEAGGFADRAAAGLAQNYTVLLVSDFPSDYLGGARLPTFSAARLRGDGALILREHYYFHLRRRIADRAAFFAVIC